MRLVVGAVTLERVREQGGALFVWPRAHRRCAGRTWTLSASTERPGLEPNRDLQLVHREAGLAVRARGGVLERSGVRRLRLLDPSAHVRNLREVSLRRDLIGPVRGT